MNGEGDVYLFCVIDSIVSLDNLGVKIVSAIVEIEIKVRIVRARDVDANSVTHREEVAGGIHLDLHLIDMVWRHEHLLLPAVAIAAPNDAV